MFLFNEIRILINELEILIYFKCLKRPPKITTQTSQALNSTGASTNSTAAESAAISFCNTSQVNLIQANLVPPSQEPTSSFSASSMSKLDYDSLAPLNFPSKPIIYKSEATKTVTPFQSAENLPSRTQTEELGTDGARQDEKAKLESILFSSMNASSSSMSHTYSNSNLLKQDSSSNGPMLITASSMNIMQQQQQQQLNNRFAGSVTNWPSRMMSMQQIRPQQQQQQQQLQQLQQLQLRPSYCCTICKKPGHPKSLCPEAGSLPKPEERLKFPSGIPRNKMRIAKPDDKVRKQLLLYYIYFSSILDLNILKY